MADGIGIFEKLEQRVAKLEELDALTGKALGEFQEKINELENRVEELEKAPTPQPEPEPTPPITSKLKTKIGINFHTLATWSQEILFSNVMMNASPMRLCKAASPTTPWEIAEALPALGELGLPLVNLPLPNGNTVRWDLFCKNGQKYLTGNYELVMRGDAEITIICGDYKKVFTTSGTFSIPTLDPEGIQVVVTKNNASNPLSHLSIHKFPAENLPGFNPQIFRFMDLMKTNGSGVKDRFVNDYAYPHPVNGAPMKYLSMGHGAAGWFCLPHQSTENYLREFAAWLKSTDYKKVYIEYSNELWNGSFTQTTWVKSLVPNNGANFADVTKVIATQAVSRFKFLREQLKDYSAEVKFVCAGQNANVGVAKSVAQNMSDLGFTFDVISSAPYWNVASADIPTTTTLQDVLAKTFAYLVSKVIPGMRAHIDLAAQYSQLFDKKVEYIAYECGQHLVPNEGLPYTAAYLAAQKTPQMKQMYKDFITAAEALGADGLIFFNSVQEDKKSGCWGLQNYTGQPLSESPKLQAIIECMRDGLEKIAGGIMGIQEGN